MGVSRTRRGKAGLSGLFLWLLLMLTASGGATVAQPLLLDVQEAGVGYDPRTGEAIVTFKFSAASARVFADLTRENVGRRMAIGVDGLVYLKPVIREPIVGGTGQIMGGFSDREAKELAARLRSGAAKIELEIVPD
jgi:preprotein translocase subunit SecD